jgi:hypothetical protein
MTGRALRRRDRRLDEAAEAAIEAVDEPVLALQRSAGNRAVSGLVQRQGSGGFTFSPIAPRAPDLRLGPGATAAMGAPAPTLSEEAAGKVRAYLEGRRYEIGNRVGEGTISMPEVVQAVRENVPEAASAPVPDIEKQVRAVFGGITPPPERRKRTAEGAGSEIAARIANALPGIPKLKINLSRGSIELTASGLVGTTKVGSAKVTATGTPSGGEVKAEQGSTSVAVTAGTDAFGLSAKMERASFEAKIEKDDKAGTWSKWELGLRVALSGDEALEQMSDIPELRDTVTKAEAGIRAIIDHLQAGGSPTDSKVKELLKDVKPAIEGVKRAIQAPKGPRVTVGGTVKGGDEKLGTFAGVSLIVEF